MIHPSTPTTPDSARAQRGSVMVYLALTLVAFGVLAMAGASRYGASIMGVSAPNCAAQARMMAESGVRYAAARLRTVADQPALTNMVATLNGMTQNVGSAGSFTLTVTDAGSGTVTVSAVGTSCSGSSYMPGTNASTTTATSVNVPAVSGGTPGEGISFTDGMDSFISTSGFSGGEGVSVDTVAKTISLGNSLYANSASVWYTGSRDVCTEGNCTLGNGLCAYYEFQFTSGSTGDGFVWTIMSGETNTARSNGGDTGRGELLGYGGLGSSGLGILPPKFGVEFDIYTNSGTGSVCSVGNRADANSRDHVAHVFWGAQTVSGCSATYDDNRHGAGTAGSTTSPMNSENGDGSGEGYDGYYYRGSNSWMKGGGKFYYRYEMDRSTTANKDGSYCYQIRSWVKTSGDSYPSGLNNCTIPYTGPPDVTSVVNLSADMHSKLTKVFFGWTEGTGGATQLAILSNFSLYYKAAPTLPVVPQDYVAGWSFYEAAGTTAHDMNATNNNSGTLQNGVQWVPGINCPNCAAVRFSSSTDRIEVNDSNSLDLTATGSVACWINIQSYSNTAGLVHKGVNNDSSDESYSLQFTTGRKVALYISQDSTTYRSVESATALSSDDKWYHVAATWDASEIKIYINGVLSNTATNTGSIAAQNSAGDLLLGAQFSNRVGGGGGWWGFNRYPFAGLMDEVYLYNRVLTATEIANMALGHP
ncbi:MAG: LamG domain-containing protein [Humidesulfovibrio sp.]|uniref:LamG domain-containing protein n=1 Tax=Humidesulfovibrio sp. TaxID=2910988 RepID=UPI0027E9C91E|nr:LamG domain-containing protein [Humidesulfovibrio sp.]MDQ7836661.1 LamG domain-containing protein [Humidesulfovibrio sp.]